MKNRKTAGFTYVEVVIGMAVLLIILAPLLPSLTQAGSNLSRALARRAAQGQAAALAQEARANPGSASAAVTSMAAQCENEFLYRLSMVNVGGGSRYYTAGPLPEEEITPPGGASFSTGFDGLFSDGVFVVAEVFDSAGNLAGLSVGKINGIVE